MPAFAYAALDPRGKERKGLLEADSSRQARQLLREQGLTPLKVDAAVARQSAQASQSAPAAGLSIRVGDLAMITRQLATLLQSSMPLEEALAAISQQTDSAKVRSIVSAVRTRVTEGHSLANSMAEFPRAFPELYRATVSAGEHAGQLDLVLNRLADYTERSHESRQKAQLALLYPVLLFVLSIAIVVGLMAFVVPDVVEVFVGQGQTLPFLTRALIVASDVVVNYGIWIVLALVLAIFVVRLALGNSQRRQQWHKLLLKLPLVGKLSRGNNTARYASTLSILASSGVPLVDAMTIAAQVLSNSWLREQVVMATQQVREGGNLSQALQQCGYFPPMMIHMIASGEASGELASMLERVAQSQQRELDNLVATLIGIFEPAMLLFMGAAVLTIVLAILQPIFELNQLI